MRGGFNLVTGEAGEGKSTLMILAAISAIQQGLRVWYVDAERKLNVNYAYASGMGKPNKDYKLAFPESLESTMDLIRRVSEAGAADLIIVDSWTALPSISQLQGDMSDQHMALAARKFSDFFQRALGAVGKHNVCVLGTSQYRTGFGTGFAYRIKTGGKAKDYYNAVAVEIDAATFEPDKDEPKKSESNAKKWEMPPIGMTINGQLWKTVYGPNFQKFSAQVRYYPFLMTNTLSEIIELGKEFGILTKEDGTKPKTTSANLYHMGEKLGNTSSAIEYLSKPENTETAEILLDKVQSIINTTLYRDKKE